MNTYTSNELFSLQVIRGVLLFGGFNMLEDIFSFENLYESHKECRKTKQHKGEVIRFETNLSFNLEKIRKELITKKYTFGKYKTFLIYEPKKRLIEAPPYKDRVVIRCFCDYVLKLKIENKLIYDNAACRKNKGTNFAISRLEKFLHHEYLKENNNNIYYLKCDISKYFPSINHDILINLLEKIDFTDDELWYIRKVIQNQPSGATIGLPLGNQTSQWFALYYLNSVDRLIKEKLKVKGYIRYMDDMILISRDKNYLKKCLFYINKLCNEELKLSLNGKTQIGKVSNGIDFLGYRHILNVNGKIIRKLRATSKVRLKRHVKTLNKLRNKEIIDDNYVNLRKNAYYEYVKKTNESRNLKCQLMSTKC